MGGRSRPASSARAIEVRCSRFVDCVDDPRSSTCLQLPHVDCVARPSSSALLEQMVKQALRSARSSVERALATIRPACHGIIGDSSQMADIFARITKVAVGDVNVCIQGESGTGKELIARAIHYASARRDSAADHARLHDHPRGSDGEPPLRPREGAFTGATEHREGVFALAHTGTLFIDELGELSPALQAKLLRVIQGREFVQGGRDEADPDGYPAHHGDEQGPPGGCGARYVPRGSLLPGRGLHDQGARRSANGPKTFRAWSSTSCSGSRASTESASPASRPRRSSA